MGFGPAFGALSTGAGLVTTTALTGAAVGTAEKVIKGGKRKKKRAKAVG